MRNGKFYPFHFLVIITIFGISILYTRFYLHTEDVIPLRNKLTSFPINIKYWKGYELGLGPDILAAAGVDDYIMRNYTSYSSVRDGNNSPPINLYVGYYESQRKGKTYHSPQNCLPGSGWQITNFEKVPISFDGEKTFLVNKALIKKGLEKKLVLYWYQDRGRIIASEYWAKFYLIYDAITRHRTDGAMVRIIASVSDSVENTFAYETTFAKAIFPFLREYLPD